MSKLNAVITGIGAYIPDDVLTNDDISKMVDTTDEWIIERVGVKERRILKDKTLGVAFMGIQAVNQLFEKTGVDPKSINGIICATSTGDYHFPSTASIIAYQTGCVNAFAFDMLAACSGFVYGIETASNYIRSGRYKRILFIAGDKMTAITDYTDRTTCPLFGDSCGALLIEPTTEPFGLIDTILRADGSGLPHLHMKAGGSVRKPSYETIDNKEHYVYQEGKVVFKRAVTEMADVAAELVERNGLAIEDIQWIVPHQANMRIIDAAARRLGVDMSKVMTNIQKYGNTSSGSIPLCLWEWENQLKKGDNVITAAVGAGFAWGANYLKWGYDGFKLKDKN
jgi:3-oxoacyl-[acyl-carrier-protein] synthase-3